MKSNGDKLSINSIITSKTQHKIDDYSFKFLHLIFNGKDKKKKTI